MRYKPLKLNKLPNWVIYRDFLNKFNFSFHYPIPFRYPVPNYSTFEGITYRDIISDIDIDDIEIEVLLDNSVGRCRAEWHSR